MTRLIRTIWRLKGEKQVIIDGFLNGVLKNENYGWKAVDRFILPKTAPFLLFCVKTDASCEESQKS